MGSKLLKRSGMKISHIFSFLPHILVIAKQNKSHDHVSAHLM